MARLSVPANPVDEQILSLQRQLANTQNELECLREEMEAERAASKEVQAGLSRELESVSLSLRKASEEGDLVRAFLGEKDGEIKYLQGQLEQLIGEKLDLQTKLTEVEGQLSSNQIAKDDHFEVMAQMKLELEKLKEQVARLEDENAELEACRQRLEELENANVMEETPIDPKSLPPCESVLKMRELQARVQALTQAFLA